MAKSTTKPASESLEGQNETTKPVEAAGSAWDAELRSILGGPALKDLEAGGVVYVTIGGDGLLSKPVYKHPPQTPHIGIRRSTRGNFITLTGAPVMPSMNPDKPPNHVPTPEERAANRERDLEKARKGEEAAA